MNQLKILLLAVILGCVIGLAGGAIYESSQHQRGLLREYATSKIIYHLPAFAVGKNKNRKTNMQLYASRVKEKYPEIASRLDESILWMAYWSLCGAVTGFASFLILRDLMGGSRKPSKAERGTAIVGPEELRRITKKSRIDAQATVGGLPFPTEVEAQGLLLTGAPGSGKSQAFFELATSARARLQSAVVADLGGEFVSRFYRPERDCILNPFDSRSKCWSPWAEIKSAFDVNRTAASLVPSSPGESESWDLSARALLETVMHRCLEAGPQACTNSSLVYLCLAAPAEELKTFVAGSAVATFLDVGNEKFLGSVRSILARQLQPLQWLDPEAGQGAFSIRKWVDTSADTFLFVSYRDDQLAALRPLLAAMLDTAASALLSRNSSDPKPMWVFLDEAASLGRMDSVTSLAAKGRKYGGRLVLGLQSIAQIRAAYGKDQAQSLLSCLGSWLVLKASDAETAEYLSQFLGDQEARRVVASGGQGTQNNAGQWRSNRSQTNNWTEQVIRHRAIMPSELQSLPNRRGILSIAGALPPAWCTVPVSNLPRAQAPFEDVEVVPVARIARPAVAGQPGSPPRELANASPVAPLPSSDDGALPPPPAPGPSLFGGSDRQAAPVPADNPFKGIR